MNKTLSTTALKKKALVVKDMTKIAFMIPTCVGYGVPGDNMGTQIEVNQNFMIAGASYVGKCSMFNTGSGVFIGEVPNPQDDNRFGSDIAVNDLTGEFVVAGRSTADLYTAEGVHIKSLDLTNATYGGNERLENVSFCENFIVVSSYRSNNVIIFDNTGNKLREINDYTGNGDDFGYSVCVTNDLVAVCAAEGASSEGTNSGRVFIFNPNDGTFITELIQPIEHQIAYARFGFRIIINVTTGNIYVSDLKGHAYAYQLDGTFITEILPQEAGDDSVFGIGIVFDDNYLVLSDHNMAGTIGFIHIYDVNTFELLHLEKRETTSNEWYGWSKELALLDNKLIVGFPGFTSETNSGAIEVYDLIFEAVYLGESLYNESISYLNKTKTNTFSGKYLVLAKDSSLKVGGDEIQEDIGMNLSIRDTSLLTISDGQYKDFIVSNGELNVKSLHIDSSHIIDFRGSYTPISTYADATRYIMSHTTGTIVYDTMTNEMLFELSIGGWITVTQGKLYMIAHNRKTIHCYDLTTGLLITEIVVTNSPMRLISNSQYIFTVGNNKLERYTLDLTGYLTSDQSVSNIACNETHVFYFNTGTAINKLTMIDIDFNTYDYLGDNPGSFNLTATNEEVFFNQSSNLCRIKLDGSDKVAKLYPELGGKLVSQIVSGEYRIEDIRVNGVVYYDIYKNDEFLYRNKLGWINPGAMYTTAIGVSRNADDSSYGYGAIQTQSNDGVSFVYSKGIYANKSSIFVLFKSNQEAKINEYVKLKDGSLFINNKKTITSEYTESKNKISVNGEVSLDFIKHSTFDIDLTESTNVDTLSNMNRIGQTGVIIIKQDDIGDKEVTFSDVFELIQGFTSDDLTTNLNWLTAHSVAVINYRVIDIDWIQLTLEYIGVKNG